MSRGEQIRVLLPLLDDVYELHDASLGEHRRHQCGLVVTACDDTVQILNGYVYVYVRCLEPRQPNDPSAPGPLCQFSRHFDLAAEPALAVSVPQRVAEHVELLL